jgi:hypothetical protein
MEYHVRTAYGVSSQAFSNAIDWILGIMQGSGHSCSGWGLTSSVMLDQMDDTTGATLHSPQPQRQTKRTGEAFVDDTSLWIIRLGLALTMAVTIMQNTAQRWERLLYATGGALNRAKCFWYGIQWTFSPGGAPKMDPSTDDDLRIHLTSGTDPHPEPIQRISTATGKRTLGVRLAPDGNDRDEFDYRMQQASTMKHRVAAAPLGREHIGIGFRAIWRMMIQYPIGATCFTKKQCDNIQAKYLPVFLSKMGINRTTSRAVRHGPPHLGGMDIYDLNTEQGVMHTKLVIAHLRKQDPVGRTLSISLDHLQLQAGVSWPVLSQPGHQQRKYVDECYLSQTWEFLDTTDTHIRMEPTLWLQPQRASDTFIMEELSLLPGVTAAELTHAQRCRLYLRVTTLADITTSNGRQICHWALKGLDNPRTPQYRYPRQDKPSPPIWATWRKLLRRRYCTTKEQHLDTPLGQWHHGQVHQVWDSVIDPTTSLIYIWSNGRVRIYKRCGRSQKQYRYQRPHTTNSFPRGSVPISGTHQASDFIITGYATFTSRTPNDASLGNETSLMNRGATHNAPLAILAQAIWDGHAILGTDGSVRDDTATYAWVLSTNVDVTADAKGGGVLPPTATYASHYSK